jgi:hypothetical protein
MLRLTFMQKTSALPDGRSRETTPLNQTRSGDGVLEIIIYDSKVIEVRPREPARFEPAALRDPN